jgi:tight adherence protein B
MAEQKKADQKKSRKVSLHLRMRQGGVMWSRNTYLLITLCLSVIGVLFLYFVYEASPFISACFGIAFGLTVPHAYVSFRRSRRLKLFAKEFPNAVDIVARGLRTGLPLGDCMRIIAQEAASPVKDEFQILVDDQMLGETLSVATENMSHRVPLTEVKFFAIVIAIQNKTGGSLSESFDNLSRVLRERKMMSEKIKSVSQEAKSSAAIIGSLPFMVTLIIYLLDPDYINLLFTTGTGNLVLTLSGVWMLCGIMIMRKMINFDF